MAMFKTEVDGVAPPERLLCFDLENRPLAYWYDGQTTSEITAFGWKWSDEDEVRTMLLERDGRYVDNEGTSWPARAAFYGFRSSLARADLVYGHNIRRHDLPMFQAGLIRLGLPILPELRTSDTLKDLPKRKDMSFSLENLSSFLGIEGEKYTMSQPMWESANKLTDEGIALARKRVVSDVLLQERLRDKLIELGLLRAPRMWKP